MKEIKNMANKPHKPYCVGDATTNTIIGRYETAEEAATRTTGNPRDLLSFHEAHAENLGMQEDMRAPTPRRDFVNCRGE